MDRLWSSHTIGHYSALKRNEPSSNKMAWRNYKCILLREIASLKRLHTVSFQLYDAP